MANHIKHINKKKSPHYTALPIDNVGFYSYSPPGNQFATINTIQSIMHIGVLWAAFPLDDGPSYPFGIGDISYEDGHKFKPHQTHRDGKCIDVRPIRKDREKKAVTWKSEDYDRDETTRLIQLFLLHPNVSYIYFNDPKIDGVKYCANHDNHLHVKFKS